MRCTTRYVSASQVALLLYEAGADPYAAAQGGESAIDALRRIGGRSSMDLHAELTSRVASRGAAQPGPEAAAAAAGGGEDEDEEGEEEGEEEEGEEEGEEEEEGFDDDDDDDDEEEEP